MLLFSKEIQCTIISFDEKSTQNTSRDIQRNWVIIKAPAVAQRHTKEEMTCDSCSFASIRKTIYIK